MANGVNPHWLATARGWLYSNGRDNGDEVTLSFEKGGQSLAKLLQAAYDQGRRDAEPWLVTGQSDMSSEPWR